MTFADAVALLRSWAWQWLRGDSLDTRLTRALELVAEFEASAWKFAPPLG